MSARRSNFALRRRAPSPSSRSALSCLEAPSFLALSFAACIGFRASSMATNCSRWLEFFQSLFRALSSLCLYFSSFFAFLASFRAILRFLLLLTVRQPSSESLSESTAEDSDRSLSSLSVAARFFFFFFFFPFVFSPLSAISEENPASISSSLSSLLLTSADRSTDSDLSL